MLSLTARGSNRCESPAVDPLGEILLCTRHLAYALELAGHLPGISISLTTQPPLRSFTVKLPPDRGEAGCARPVLGPVPS